jgi:hypothetical protein
MTVDSRSFSEGAKQGPVATGSFSETLDGQRAFASARDHAGLPAFAGTTL